MAEASSFLGNIKVSRKLGAGFGVLLLAVGAVAFIGYSSSNVLVDRLDTTRLIGTLNDATQDMRCRRSSTKRQRMRRLPRLISRS
jgi:methyl-accepting chemotaxis protein